MGISTYFFLDDIDMSTYHIKIGREGSQGLWIEDFISEVEDYTESVPNKSGAYFYGSVIKPKQITIPIYTEEGLTEAEKVEVQKLLYCKTEKKLVFDSEAYKCIYVKSFGKSELRFMQYSDGKYYGFCDLNYIAYSDPLWKSYYNSLVSDDGSSFYTIYSNLSVIPSDIGTAAFSSVTTGFSCTLNNVGSYMTPLIVALEGSGTTITISNTTRDESFTISSLVGTSVCINSKIGSVNNSTIATSVLSTSSSLKTSLFTTGSDFIYLDPGENSLVVSGATGSLNLSSVKFLYNHTFL